MVQAFNQFGGGPNSTVLYASVDAEKTRGSSMGAGAALAGLLSTLLSLCS
jgi:hypothetical protein